MEQKLRTLSLPPSVSSRSTLRSLKVGVGDPVQKGTILAAYSVEGAEEGEESSATMFKSTVVGKVCEVLHQEGDTLQPK